MFGLGQDIEEQEIKQAQEKIESIKNIAEFRDQLFDESQGKIMKLIGGAVLGMYLIYRFLMK